MLYGCPLLEKIHGKFPGGGGGGVLGYILGGYVPPGSPNLDPVLERICTQNDTPF